MKCPSLDTYVRWRVEELAVEQSFKKSGLNKPDGTPKHNFPDDFLDGLKDRSVFLNLLSPKERKRIRKSVPVYKV